MDVNAAKLIAAGLATMGVIGAGIGVGNVWAAYIAALARNPYDMPTLLALANYEREAGDIGAARTRVRALLELAHGEIIGAGRDGGLDDQDHDQGDDQGAADDEFEVLAGALFCA